MTKASVLRVVVGVIVNKPGLVLIAQRPANVHLGGLWEFPGGKVEAGETALEALHRELHEELGIQVVKAEPLIQICHDYQEKSVHLDVWRVSDFSGNPSGKEDQPVRWVSRDRLDQYPFPEANRAIITALRLPGVMPILNDRGEDWGSVLARLEKLGLQRDVKLLIYRAPEMELQTYRARAEQLAMRCLDMGLGLMLNCSLDTARGLPVAGVHLNSQRLLALSETGWRKPESILISASCHTPEDLRAAERLSLDFALLSPVKATQSHPGQEGLGWTVFASHVASAALPVYALGGMQRSDLQDAVMHGAQGIAGISCF